MDLGVTAFLSLSAEADVVGVEEVKNGNAVEEKSGEAKWYGVYAYSVQI